jgi:gas vesicle protein
MNRLVAFLAGAVCGAAVGVTAAMLLAPASGSELQTSVRDWFESLWDDAQRAADDKRAALEGQLYELKSQ